MAFRIEKADDIIEVHLWGEGDESEVLTILRKLHEMAPRKEISDLWLISEEYVVPWVSFLPIVKGGLRPSFERHGGKEIRHRRFQPPSNGTGRIVFGSGETFAL